MCVATCEQDLVDTIPITYDEIAKQACAQRLLTDLRNRLIPQL